MGRTFERSCQRTVLRRVLPFLAPPPSELHLGRQEQE